VTGPLRRVETAPVASRRTVSSVQTGGTAVAETAAGWVASRGCGAGHVRRQHRLDAVALTPGDDVVGHGGVPGQGMLNWAGSGRGRSLWPWVLALRGGGGLAAGATAAWGHRSGRAASELRAQGYGVGITMSDRSDQAAANRDGAGWQREGQRLRSTAPLSCGSMRRRFDGRQGRLRATPTFQGGLRDRVLSGWPVG